MDAAGTCGLQSVLRMDVIYSRSAERTDAL